MISRGICGIVFNKLIDIVLVVVEWFVGSEFKSEKLSSEDEHTHENDELVDTLADDVSPHGGIDNHSSLAHWLTVHESIMGWLSCECKGSESIHDKVYPNEHHSVHCRVSGCAVANDDGDKYGQVASNLELEETLDV